MKSATLTTGIIHQLECAAGAVRRNDLEIAMHYVGNTLLMLKQAQSGKPAKRKRLEPPAALRRVK